MTNLLVRGLLVVEKFCVGLHKMTTLQNDFFGKALNWLYVMKFSFIVPLSTFFLAGQKGEGTG